MVKRKSSRVHDMNYKYTIKDENIYEYELENESKRGYIWKIEYLKTEYHKNPLIEQGQKLEDSFNRTRNWLKENRPEVLI